MVFERKIGSWIWMAIVVLVAPAAARAVSLDAFGIKGGVAWMAPDFQYQGEELFEPDSTVGVAGGVYAEWKAHRRSKFNVMTEVLYVERGYEADRSVLFEPGAPTPERKVKASYLSFPVLLRSNVASEGVSLFLFFGPSVNVLLDADPDPVLDHYNDLVLVGHAGLGLERELHRRVSATIELRFSSEFTNAFEKTEDGPVATLESVRHYVLQLQSGVRF